MIRSRLRILVLAGLAVGAAGLARAQDTPPQPEPAPAPSLDQPPPAEASPSPPTDQPPLPESLPAPPPRAEPTAESPPSAETPAPAPAAVQVQSLSQLDLFSTGRETGLGVDVWKGASADIARTVIPSLAAKPLSPAAMDLARRLLAQASTAPVGAGSDLDLAVARAKALLALGDADDASLVLDRTPSLADHADLSELAAEAALISEQDDKACRVADNLSDGRSGTYWLWLRAFCQARAGKSDAAQLTFSLAGPPPKNRATPRLLEAFIAGAGDPGPASLRDGLDFALSRALKLDLAPALDRASPAISRRWLLKNPPPAAPAPSFPPDSVQALIQAAADTAGTDHPDPAVLQQLIDRAGREASPRTRARLQEAAVILASLEAAPTGASRAALAGFEVTRSAAPAARLIALNLAATAGLKGETALLALQVAQAGGETGPVPVDRFWVVQALERAGLPADARAFAVEGLIQLRGGT